MIAGSMPVPSILARCGIRCRKGATPRPAEPLWVWPPTSSSQWPLTSGVRYCPVASRPSSDGSFAAYIAVEGTDEHGLPILAVTLFPLVATTGSSDLGHGFGLDNRFILDEVFVPLEETRLSVEDVSSLPLHEEWTVVSLDKVGLRASEVKATFGVRAAVYILAALGQAYLSESVNQDVDLLPYRESENLFTGNYDVVLAMHHVLTDAVRADEELEEVRLHFYELIAASFSS